MYNSKFLRLFQHLDKKEAREFGYFLQAFYANHQKPLRLFEHILACYPQLNSSRLQKKKAAVMVFEDPDIPYKRIDNELHKLSAWLEEFLAWRQIKKNTVLKQQTLLEAYKEKQLDKLFYQQLEKLKARVRQEEMSIDKFHRLLQLEHLEYYYTPTHKINKRNQSIQNAIEYLDCYQQLLRLKYECELNSRNKILRPEEEAEGEQASKMEEEELLDREYFFLDGMLSKLANLIEKPSLKVFGQLKEMMEIPAQGNPNKEVRGAQDLHLKNLNDEDQDLFLSYLINYTIELNKQGDENGTKEALDLYKKGIENEMILIDGYISEAKFLNIVNTACQQKEFEWAEQFVVDYQHYLPKEWKEALITIAMARITFGQLDYEKTLVLLRDVPFRDHTHTIHAKLLQLRSFYELGSGFEESLFSLINSFNQLLYREKILNERVIESCRNFVKILELLVHKKKEKSHIQEKIDAYQLLACKPWLLKKLEDYPA